MCKVASPNVAQSPHALDVFDHAKEAQIMQGRPARLYKSKGYRNVVAGGRVKTGRGVKYVGNLYMWECSPIYPMVHNEAMWLFVLQVSHSTTFTPIYGVSIYVPFNYNHLSVIIFPFTCLSHYLSSHLVPVYNYGGEASIAGRYLNLIWYQSLSTPRLVSAANLAYWSLGERCKPRIIGRNGSHAH